MIFLLLFPGLLPLLKSITVLSEAFALQHDIKINRATNIIAQTVNANRTSVVGIVQKLRITIGSIISAIVMKATHYNILIGMNVLKGQLKAIIDLEENQLVMRSEDKIIKFLYIHMLKIAKKSQQFMQCVKLEYQRGHKR